MPSTAHGCVRSSLMRPRGQLSGSGWRGCPVWPFRETVSASPQGAASGSWSFFRWTGWVPRLHPHFFGESLPNGWSSALSGRKGQPIRVDWLAEEPNGSARCSHLLTVAAFRLAANPNEVLKAQEFRAFLLVHIVLHQSVASL